MARFSIIITCYNQREFAKEAVDSVLRQLSGEDEIIVIDDASTDGSPGVLKEYGDAIRLVCFETNQGACEARNHGAAIAAGEYIVILDADDALAPWTLEVYGKIVKERKPVMILARHRWFEGKLPAPLPEEIPREIRLVQYQDVLCRDRPLGEPSGKVFERKAFQAVQGWSQSVWLMENTDLLLRLGTTGRTILVCAPWTTFYRQHGGNVSANVSVFFPPMHRVIDYERSGRYPGGKARRFERRARVGARVLSLVKKGFAAGQARGAALLLARGWTMVMAAILHKLQVSLKPRQPLETIKL